MRAWIFVTGLSLAAIPCAASADDISIESHAGFGTASGNKLMPPGTFVAAPTISLTWRHHRLATELNSALISGGGPGDMPTYWSLGPGFRYYLPLASGIRNNIEVELSVYGRAGVSWVSQTEDGLNQTATGYSTDYGTGLELSLVRVTSPVIAKLQLAASSRILSIDRRAEDKSARGIVSTASFGWTVGARF
jgi:hypothetical protein